MTPFTYESMPIKDLSREPKGTIGVYFCEWGNLSVAQSRIMAQFKQQSQPIKGDCKITSFATIDTRTGIPFRVIQVEVLRPLPPRRKRGPKLGSKRS